jgi:hypothetical protein
MFQDRLEREAKYNKNKQQDTQPITKTPSVNASLATKPSSNECTVQVYILIILFILYYIGFI